MINAITKSLELLEKSRMFEVKKEYGGYEVTFKNDESYYPLSAVYCGEDRLYYIGGVYNHGRDWAPIDIGKLRELMSFCESLSGDDQ